MVRAEQEEKGTQLLCRFVLGTERLDATHVPALTLLILHLFRELVSGHDDEQAHQLVGPVQLVLAGGGAVIGAITNVVGYSVVAFASGTTPTLGGFAGAAGGGRQRS